LSARDGDGLPSGRSALVNMIERQDLPHVSSFRDNPTVFFTACTHKRRKLLAYAQMLKEGEEWQYRVVGQFEI
jgi:hypothetical protein